MLSAHLEPHGKRLRRCVVMNLPGWRTYILRAASNLLQTVYKTTGSGERIKYGGFILFLCCRHIKIDVMQRMSCFSVSHQLINNNKLFITIFYFSSSNHVHKMYILYYILYIAENQMYGSVFAVLRTYAAVRAAAHVTVVT